MKHRMARAVLGFALAVGLAVTACSDRSVTPPATLDRGADQSSLLGGLLGGVNSLLFQPLERNTPLASNVSWTFTAGPSGGFTSNSSVGLTVSIPPGALTSTTTFTVTALAGAPVAYRFEPHVDFSKTVYLTQDLSGTSAGVLNSLLLKGAHFPGSAPAYTSGGLAIVDEIVPGLTLSGKLTFGVTHFSGWIGGAGYMSSDASDGQ